MTGPADSHPIVQGRLKHVISTADESFETPKAGGVA